MSEHSVEHLYDLDKRYREIGGKTVVTILAGGNGTRMRSSVPKVLHHFLGVPMLVKIIRECINLNPYKVIVVTGSFHDDIIDTLERYHLTSSKIVTCQQKHQLGTGDAVKSTLHEYCENDCVVILNADMPAITSEFLSNLVGQYKTTKKNMIVTCEVDNPTGYGRIVTDIDDKVLRIIEEKDCSLKEKELNLINSGIYICCARTLTTVVPKILNDNAQKEYYLTSMVDVATCYSDDFYSHKLLCGDNRLVCGVNTPEQLIQLETSALQYRD